MLVFLFKCNVLINVVFLFWFLDIGLIPRELRIYGVTAITHLLKANIISNSFGKYGTVVASKTAYPVTYPFTTRYAGLFHSHALSSLIKMFPNCYCDVNTRNFKSLQTFVVWGHLKAFFVLLILKPFRYHLIWLFHHILHLQYFSGNRDQNTVVLHRLFPRIRARYIRVHPWGWYRHISMRVEFFGCSAGTAKT